MDLIGRKQEQKTFKHCLGSTESKLIAVYGRRRVGKTFLIRKYFGAKIRFEVAGLHSGNMKEQLANFSATLAKHGWLEAALHVPSSWQEAFNMLERYISSLQGAQKKVIFLDELPWFDTRRSKFLMAFEHFWNAFCTRRNDIICVICGSAASWIVKKVLKNKGGLHNRVAEKIRLTQFNLKEVDMFLKAKAIRWSKYDIAQLYMTTGGIPYYLDAIRKGESVVQFINRACFTKDGVLENEYKILFSSLFDSELHSQIVAVFNGEKTGLTRKEIIAKTNLPSGGSLSTSLNELEESGFIEKIIPYDKNKTKLLYKLTDNFTIFYLKFMKNYPANSHQNWNKIIKSQSWISWSGLAYERLCFNHLPQIERALRLEAVENNVTSWEKSDSEQGAQIDMIIDRADRIINVCEIKFAKADFIIDKAYAKKLRNKINLFSTMAVNKRKTVFLTMITTFGVSDNEYCKELVQNEVTLEDMFE